VYLEKPGAVLEHSAASFLLVGTVREHSAASFLLVVAVLEHSAASFLLVVLFLIWTSYAGAPHPHLTLPFGSQLVSCLLLPLSFRNVGVPCAAYQY